MSLLLLMIRLPLDMAQRAHGLTGLLKRGYGLRNSPLDATRLHITLFDFKHHVDLPLELVELVKAAVGSVAATPFEVMFDCVAVWPAPRALVLLSSEEPTQLIVFRRKLSTALEEVGLGHMIKPGFTPHITLMREVEPDSVENQQVMSFRWTVRDVALVNSLTGHGRYVELRRWPLRE